ncbi:MAG TPA: hypothetical protein VHV51_21380 [Polyangiaceae bacterium]|jgi:hypothetical protein|nr:hypothetical protein [Polyangiaceae bacterium]
MTIARVALGVWLGFMLLLGSALLAKHVVALPEPTKDRHLAASLSALRAPSSKPRWLAVHVLYSECRCSQRVVAHLISTTRPPAWEEILLWVGNGAPDPALDRNFHVKRVSSAELARLGVESAPMLVVLDPEDGIRYVGGYTTRKQGPVIEDLHIMQDAERGNAFSALPILGCAMSDRLKRELSILPGL